MKNTISRPLSSSFLLRRLYTTAASSTETLVVAKAAPATNAMYMSNASDRRLFVRLSKLGATGGKASDVLNKYMREGRQIKKQNLMDCFRTFRKFKRYQICLELLEWLEQHKFHLSERDYAVYLDIIFKTKGVEEAEKYFNSLSSVSKNLYSYGALLNCYCMERMTEKAFSLFKEMEQLNYASTCLAFNNMMRLCLNEGKPERVPPLLQEMRKSDVAPDRYTYNIVLQSYAAMNDVKGIESILEEMQPEQCDWTSFSNLVTVYNKVGLPDKAELVLHQLEKFLENQKHPERMAYHYLITLYAGTGNLDAVNRAWEALNSKYPPCSNLSYLCMLQSLSKLDDIKGLKTCYEEWESRCRIYDNRLTAVVINAYLRHDMLEKAEKAYVIANIRSRFPCVKAHECFIAYFLGKGETDRALVHLEHLVEAQSVMEGTRWRPSTRIIYRALEYFEREKDVKNAEKLCRFLKKSKHLDSKGYLLLLQVYVAAGETEPEMRQRMEKDGIDISSEHESLLDKVCVQ